MAALLNCQETSNAHVVYVGEIYLYERYERDDASVFNPNDEQDMLVTAQQQVLGERCYFITAVVDANYKVPAAEQSACDKAHLLSDTLIIFQGGKKQIKDFRGMFYHNSFLNWMEALFAALEVRRISNTVIVMDDTKHHRELPPGTPTKAMTRQELQRACANRGIAFDDTELRSMLWGKLQRYIQDHVQPTVCALAVEKGHEVVFSPPHNTELQPMENVWAVVKGKVGRQYARKSTSEHVSDRLQRAFDELTSEDVQQCIDSANANLAQLMAHVSELDTLDMLDNHDSNDEDGDEQEEEEGVDDDNEDE
uniref:Tc1-like transposase DDE domain-containing protein n=1 Tax=Globisporangium ultimum (strain ATCC 200006 / CBS 805.95 / DAOM BR144) TaxID=431595 RepID=K3X0G4_GLOUD